MRVLPAGFVPPCLPTKAQESPSGPMWLHEIKHDGFRVIARKDDKRVRLYSRDEHGAPLARPRKAAASSRTARSGLRLVHRRVRDARSEEGEGVTRRAGVMASASRAGLEGWPMALKRSPAISALSPLLDRERT